MDGEHDEVISSVGSSMKRPLPDQSDQPDNAALQEAKRQRTETDEHSQEPASPLPRGRSGKLSLKEVLALLNADTADAQAQGLRALKGDGRRLHEVMTAYVESSPECVELFRLWENNQKASVRDWHVEVGVVECLALILSGGHAQSTMRQTRIFICRRVMRHLMKTVYSNLASGSTRSASAALQLLTHVVGTSTATAREFTQQFDFAFKGLPKLAKARTQKQPTQRAPENFLRRQFIRFCGAFLRTGDLGIVGAVVRKGLFAHLWRDLPHDSLPLAQDLLPVLHEHVLLNPLLPNKLKQYIFTPFAVEQVARLLKAACGRQDVRLQRLVSNFIRDVAATDAGLFGSAPTPSNTKAAKALSEAEQEKQRKRERAVVRLLAALDANMDPVQQRLVLQVLKANPRLIPDYVAAPSYSLDPRPTLLWLANVNLFARVLSLPIDHQSGIALPPAPLLGSATAEHEEEERDAENWAVKAAEQVVPHPVNRSVLGRALQHQSRLVQSHGLLLLLAALRRVESVRAPPGLEARLRQAIAARLPDVQTLLSLHQRYAPRAAIGDPDALHYSLLLRALAHYQQTLDLVPPSLALEAKLLGKDLRQLAPEALDTVMRILTHSTRVHGWTMKAGSRDSPFARLAQLLLHFSPEEGAVYDQVWGLIEAQLVDQREGLFPNGPAELRAWVRHLRDPASLKLLDQALGALLLHPYAFAARLASLPPPPPLRSASPASAAPCSPLLFAVLDALVARSRPSANDGDGDQEAEEDGEEMEMDEVDEERVWERAAQEIYVARAVGELLHSGTRYTALAIAHALNAALPHNRAAMLPRLTQLLAYAQHLCGEQQSDAEQAALALRRACAWESVGRVPPISIALAEARLRRGHPEALFHVQRRIPQLTDARLLLAASRQATGWLEDAHRATEAQALEVVEDLMAHALSSSSQEAFGAENTTTHSSAQLTYGKARLAAASSSWTTGGNNNGSSRHLVGAVQRAAVGSLPVDAAPPSPPLARPAGAKIPHPPSSVFSAPALGIEALRVKAVVEASSEGEVAQVVSRILALPSTSSVFAPGHAIARLLPLILSRAPLSLASFGRLQGLTLRWPALGLEDHLLRILQGALPAPSSPLHFLPSSSSTAPSSPVQIAQDFTAAIKDEFVEGLLDRVLQGSEEGADGRGHHAAREILRFVAAWSAHHRQLVQRRLLDRNAAAQLKQPDHLQRLLPVVSACLLHHDAQPRLLATLAQQTDLLIKALDCDADGEAAADSLVARSAAHVLERCYVSTAASSSAVAKLRARVLGGIGAELRSSARLSLAYALTCCSTAAGASVQNFIEHALGALTSVLALDDAHPFRAQVVATLEAAVTKARELGVAGRDETGLEWVASLRAADDVAGLLRGRVGGLVPALVRHFCPVPGTTTTTAKAKTAPALYRLVVSSPAFAHVLRSPNAASPSALPTHAKHSLALLLYTLYRHGGLEANEEETEEGKDTPEAEVARRLLEAYGASGHPTDRLLLRCLRLLEAHDACNLASLVLRWRPRTSAGKKGTDEEDEDEELDDEACAERLLTLVQEGRALTPARLLHSHSHFIATVSDDVDALADSRACGCNRQGCTEVWESYDGAWVLPLVDLAATTAPASAVDARKLVEAGTLPYCLHALSSPSLAVRRMANSFLVHYTQLLKSADFRERPQITQLLRAVRNAMVEAFQRLPAYIASFTAHAALVVLTPEHGLYKPVNAFLLHRPALVLGDIPMLYELWNASGPQHRIERAWILRIVAAGPGAGEDLSAYRRRHVIELALSLLGSGAVDQAARRAIVDLLAHTLAHAASAAHFVRTGVLPHLLFALLSPSAREAPRGLPYLLRSLALTLLPVLPALPRPTRLAAAPDLAALVAALARLHPSLLSAPDAAGEQHSEADERLPLQPRDDAGLHAAVFQFVDGLLQLLPQLARRGNDDNAREAVGDGGGGGDDDDEESVEALVDGAAAPVGVMMTATELRQVVEMWRSAGGVEWSALGVRLVTASRLVRPLMAAAAAGATTTDTSDQLDRDEAQAVAYLASSCVDILVDLVARAHQDGVALVAPFVRWLQALLLTEVQRTRSGAAKDSANDGDGVLGQARGRVGGGLVWLYRHWAMPDQAKSAIARALLPLIAAHLPQQQQAEASRGVWRERGAKWVRAITGDEGEQPQHKHRDELLRFAAFVFADLPLPSS